MQIIRVVEQPELEDLLTSSDIIAEKIQAKKRKTAELAAEKRKETAAIKYKKDILEKRKQLEALKKELGEV